MKRSHLFLLLALTLAAGACDPTRGTAIDRHPDSRGVPPGPGAGGSALPSSADAGVPILGSGN